MSRIIKIKAILLLFVLLGILLHNSVPHIHHEHSEVLTNNIIEEQPSHHHDHSNHHTHDHHHASEGFNLSSIWDVLIDFHSHGDKEHEINLVHFDLIKNKELASKIQLVALTNSLTSFPTPIYFENQSIPLNCQSLPPPYFDCFDLRGPPSLG